MAHYYKVPAIYEYEKEYIEVKDGERVDAKAEIEVDEETGKSYRVVDTDKVASIRPDMPKGISYVCQLVDENAFIVKADRPLKLGKDARQEKVDLAREVAEKRVSKNALRLEQSFARSGVR